MNQDDPARFLGKRFWYTAFETHPIRLPVLGFLERFKALTRDDLVRYHRRMYVPGNMVLAVTGDFDAETALAEVEKTFGAQPRGPVPLVVLPGEEPQMGPRLFEEARDIQRARLFMGFHIPNIRPPGSLRPGRPGHHRRAWAHLSPVPRDKRHPPPRREYRAPGATHPRPRASLG